MAYNEEYTFGRPEVYLTTMERARLDVYKSFLHDRIPNGLPRDVEFEQTKPLEEYPHRDS